ncbi:MAG: DUF1064 domain-containing protein [Cetobacterium sp.]
MKYFNKRTNGFDSKKESKRYNELTLLFNDNVISFLETQKVFKLEINGMLICKYIADFVYHENGNMVVEDVKSSYTARLPVYRIKKKMMKAIYDIDIQEV